MVAGVLVVVGVLLWMFVSKSLAFVAGLGAFGPGILREFGWLRDHDEFQRQAARRAGYHAYLVGGVTAALVYSAHEWSVIAFEPSSEWVLFVLLMLWMSWMFSALLSYWGACKTASRVLIIFGSFWAVFVVASLIGESSETSLSETLLGMLVGTGLIAAFFVPAWTVYRWPRATGALLLVLTAAVFLVFGGKGGGTWASAFFSRAMLLGPLLVSGIALLQEKPDDDEVALDETLD